MLLSYFCPAFRTARESLGNSNLWRKIVLAGCSFPSCKEKRLGLTSRVDLSLYHLRLCVLWGNGSMAFLLLASIQICKMLCDPA